MTTHRSIALAAVLAFAIIRANPAWAETDDGKGWLSEIRFGLLDHDEAPIVANVESGVDFNAEMLFVSPRALRGIGAPRPYVGATVATEGTSHVHAGLSWDYDFSSRWFVTGAVGLAAHDGHPLQEWEQTPREHETEKALGCRVVFHLYAGLGFRLSRHWNVAAHYEHLSNATLCGSNGGLESLGIRIGRAF
jgi:lipid A 3-O-deacylase